MPLALAEVHDAGFPPSWRAGATSDGRGSNATFTPRVCDHALSSVNLADACQKNFLIHPCTNLTFFPVRLKRTIFGIYSSNVSS
jgi:hypothetical protein